MRELKKPSRMRWFPWILLASALVMAAIPGSFLSEIVPDFILKDGRDEVVHAIGFMFLTLGFRYWRGPYISPEKWLPGALVILICFAALHEGVQELITGRTPSGSDFMADLIGIAVGTALVLRFSPHSQS